MKELTDKLTWIVSIILMGLFFAILSASLASCTKDGDLCYEFVILDIDPAQESYLVEGKHYTYDQFYDKWPKGLDQCNGCESGFSKNENGDCVIYEPVVDNSLECDDIEHETFSDWTYSVGESLTLKHTAALRTMAITGNVGPLDEEFCDLGTRDMTVPTEISNAADIYDVGLASQLTLEDYIIAMWHPITEAPDHFITYNHTDSSWIHWKLGDRPTIVVQSN